MPPRDPQSEGASGYCDLRHPAGQFYSWRSLKAAMAGSVSSLISKARALPLRHGSGHCPRTCFRSLRSIEEHIRPSADHFLSMTFLCCGRAFFPSGIRTADKTIAFGKKSFVYFISLAASFICFRIIASATLAMSSRCGPCLQQTLSCPMPIIIRDGWRAHHESDGQKIHLVRVFQ